MEGFFFDGISVLGKKIGMAVEVSRVYDCLGS